nr:RNA-directed DNA polymerase, eukaryota [Tanacetum cinerariifolium]
DESSLDGNNNLGNSQQGNVNQVEVSDVEEVSDTIFEVSPQAPHVDVHKVDENDPIHSNSAHLEVNQDEPPIAKGSSSKSYPKASCFSQASHGNDSLADSSTHVSSRSTPKGGSILEVLDGMIKVGRSMGYDMEGCSKDIEQITRLQREADGMVSDELLAKGMDLSRKLHDLKQMELKDAAQKSKVNWAIEGDENSKFFHGVINKRRSQLAIRGVFVNGDWYTDPSVVKEAFLDHFTARFKQPSCSRLKLNMSFPNRLSSDQVGDLDKDISIDEIRKAVWDCGESKSPGLDDFTFEFFRHYWHFIGPDFYAAVNCFFDKGRFSRGSNLSFNALIPKVIDAKFVTDFRPISLIDSVYKVVTKILANRLTTVISGLISNTQSTFVANRHVLDGPFILNEVLAWCKRRRKQSLVFKVNFAKAYDSVRWDFLLDVLLAFGFGPKWCQWIRGIFSSNMASILINRSPSSEFPIFSGLKQASGLCINVNKSHVLGVGVPLDIVRQGALRIGCEVMQTPFKYLGVMVGDHMSRYSAWSNTIQKVYGRLSRWKVKTLSIGGCLTLLKSVLGAVPFYNMSLYKAPKCVLHELERLRNNFFKGGDSQDSKITWVAWAKMVLYGITSSVLFMVLGWSVTLVILSLSMGCNLTRSSSVSFERRHVKDGVERNQWSALLHMLGMITLSSSPD